MIIFISCTKSKQNYACKAKEMYKKSAWFRGGWSYAEKLHPEAIYILSAKYGLLLPDSVIEPYEQTLIAANDLKIKKWSAMVYNQIKKQGISRDEEVIFLCGKNYRKYLRNIFPKSKAPLEHLGIGKQLKFFKESI